MTIRQFRHSRGLSLEAFAAMIGKSKGHLCGIELSGRCSAKLALVIEEKTEGLVDAASLSPDIARARQVAA